MQPKNKRHILTKGVTSVLLLLVWLLTGCSAKNFLKEGESFYGGAVIKFEPQEKVGGLKRIENDLQALIAPEPNKVILGNRPGVWFYYVAGSSKKKKGLKHTIQQKLGRRPILLSDATPEKTASLLEGELHNTGYFKSTVKSEVETKKQNSIVTYTVELYKPYRIGDVEENLFDSVAYPKIVQDIQENTLLRENQRYRLKRLQAEQMRIEEVMQNHGSYYFDDKYLLFEGDSTVGKRKIDLSLKFEKGMPSRATRVYHINRIRVFPNYELTNDSMQTTSDTLSIEGYTYIDNQDKFRPSIITRVINLKPDSMYRRIDQEYTLSHLMGLRIFKFVNIKFLDVPSDSSALDAYIYLTPLLKKSVRMQLQAVSKSNNFVGPGYEMTFTNRNLLRGAELFQLKLHTAYEVQISRQQAGALNAFELGAESSLSVPRFITPIPIRYNSSKYLPQTNIKAAYNLQQRLQYFRLNTFNVGYGYQWRETTLKTHELFPADISFVKLSNTSAAFNDLVNQNPSLANSFQNQFILGASYAFTLNTQLTEDIEMKFDRTAKRKSNFYFKGGVDVSGNALHAIQNVAIKNPQYEFLGLPYSQFVKADVDFRYYYDVDRHSKIAMRFFAGMGYAYGNSSTLPYVKQFSSGGSNSLRGFPARSVGPGTYNVRTDESLNTKTFFIDQRGDIKLEGNAEYRFDIFKAIKGAVFVDAGNIWLRQEDTRQGSQFQFDSFLSDLAVDTGAGLRFDFSFFVLRFDLAFPLRKPDLPPNERWVMDDISFGKRDWRRQNLILNIAIGYPF